MIIDQLPEISSVQTTDEVPIERGQTTYKTPVSKIGTAIFASPALTGTPTAPTAGATVDNTQIATTAFANRAANNAVSTYVRPNLLDNWYFVGGGSQNGYGIFPVNQRGLGTYTAVGDYTIDRWAVQNSNTITFASDGIVISTPSAASSNSFALLQPLQTLLTGINYTLSIYVNDISGSYNVVFGSRGTTANRVTLSTFSTVGVKQVTGSFTSAISDPFICIRRSGTGTATSIKVVAIKLEIGDTQTLAHQEGSDWVLNEIPDYGEQLRKCQKYLWKLQGGSSNIGVGVAFAAGSSVSYLAIPNPVEMVTTTSAVVTASSPGAFVLTQSSVASGYTSTSVSHSGNSPRMTNLSISSTNNLTIGQAYRCTLLAGEYVLISHEE